MPPATPTIHIASRAELDALLDAGEGIRATWTVRCSIGPAWIGAGRRIELRVGDALMDESCEGHRLLAAAIVACFELPEAHEDEVTYGHGWIARVGGRLEIDYEWSRSVPYADSSAFEVDTRELTLPE